MLKISDRELVKAIEKGIPLSQLEARLRPELNKDDDRPDKDKNYGAETRAHAGYDDYSRVGFLGRNESLIKVILDDARVIAKHHTTHAAIAEALDKLISGKYKLRRGYAFMEPEVMTLGFQSCPWGCQDSGQNAGVIHIANLSEAERMEITLSQMGGLEENRKIMEEMAAEFKGSKDNKNFVNMKKLKKLLDIPKRTEVVYVPLTGLLPHLIRNHYFFEGKESPYRADPTFLIKALGL